MVDFRNGLVSIQDSKGKYARMQDVARDYGRYCDIKMTTNDAKQPTELVVEMSDAKDRFEPEKKSTKIKADYNYNATPKRFSSLLNCAVGYFLGDSEEKTKTKGDKSTYRVYLNNGLAMPVTKDEFYSGKTNFDVSI